MPSDADLNSVIVADNDLQLRSILRSLFVSQGFDVLLAADGLEALDFARSTLARLVILDKRMPNLDGIQACAQIRRLPGYADIPIVVLTVYDDAATRAAANEAGATRFVTKPFRPSELMEVVAPLLGIDPIDRSTSFIWKRRTEPTPVDGDAPGLSQGRKMLNIYRRGGTSPKRSR
jgi:two-component system, chemotaxis family, chemotaxis protein CheY